MIVKIKRKRDEPALPEFVLASKKPSLARLTLDDDAGSAPGGGTAATAAAGMGSFASPPPQGSRAARAGGTRYRLVGTASERGGPTVRADAAALTAAREQAAKAQQAKARYEKVQLLRSANGDGPDVLELQRCSVAAPKVKL